MGRGGIKERKDGERHVDGRLSGLAKRGKKKAMGSRGEIDTFGNIYL